MPWYVLITKPKSEIKLSDRLSKMGIEVCCPTRIERRQWSDRVKKVEVPLLPSMILVNLPDKHRADVFQVPGAVRYLYWMEKPAEVSQQEVEALKEMTKNKANIVEVTRLKKGDEIELENLGSGVKKGIVKHISGNQCWVVLKELGYVVKVELG
ncbi:MAG TPA: UpxY family transcription antiterminator [Brumimicrobium sp.]|nr:UpxY family transcription antiterminator [Brumimicrobium sp.]